MAGVGELNAAQGQLASDLRYATEQLDLKKVVAFQEYSRTVLPLDGYVFWVPTIVRKFQGSLHYSQEILQNEDETFGQATVLFTSEQPIVEFSANPTNRIYVASVNGFRFVFSQQNGFYEQAAVWHYFGQSIPPALSTQLLDTPSSIDPDAAVVSNSLPLWFGLNGYAAPYYDGFQSFPLLFPSDLVQPNVEPPYCAIHIGPNDTRPLQAAPLLDRNRNHYQLAADRVRLTLYGLQNNAAQDFLDALLQYSVDTENFGIMNMPIVLDGKRTSPGLMTLAMQKFIDVEVSYYQTRAQDIARQLILSAQAQIRIGSAVVTV